MQRRAKLNEECGVVGILGDPDAAKLIYLSLYALQHRGQEACGIVTLCRSAGQERAEARDCKAFGLVSEQIDRDSLDSLSGNQGLGHVRYSTQGGRLAQNIQPFVFSTPQHGPLVMAHNGNLTNGALLRQKLEEDGSVFTTTTDSEVFIHLLAKSRRLRLQDRIGAMMQTVKGAYSLVLLAQDRLYGIRDPHGFRPLVIGRKGEAWLLASETCALDLVGAEYVRDVEPGEVVRLSATGLESFFPLTRLEERAFCSFEPIYFSRPDSSLYGESIYQVRKRMGEALAAEAPVAADIVIAVPDSGVPMAMGYAQAAGLPLELGLVRNHYVGRTFIEPTQAIRDFGVKLKLNPVISALKGKRVIVVDDSLVRGTTSRKIIRMLREAGSLAIHMRIGSPPITHSCYYGVATPERAQLLAAQKTTAEICELLGADSLAYLSLQGLQQALGPGSRDSYCFACFNGNYPEEIFRSIAPQPTDNLPQVPKPQPQPPPAPCNRGLH